jgi:7-cyano-7-deazaguanine synthase
VSAFSQALKEGTWKGVELVSPFCKIRKEDIVKIGTELGVDYAHTYSCYKGDSIHCGVCGTCTERKEAFELAKVADPTEYKK